MNLDQKITAVVWAFLRKLRAIWETLTLQTNRKRWEKVAVGGRPAWDARNVKIASFIPAGSSVLDLGCGAQTLKGHLRPGCEYQPCDLVQSTPDVMVCDFNAGLYPKVDKIYTHVVCSGVLEYIHDHLRFLRVISSFGPTLILSYNLCRPSDSKFNRMANNWVNHFSDLDLRKVFEEAGLVAECLVTTESGEVIYKLMPKTE